MSFTDHVAEELLRLPLKKTCCRKAFLLGTMCACRTEADGEFRLYLYRAALAEYLTGQLGKALGGEVTAEETVRAGRKTYALTVRSAAVERFLASLEGSAVPPSHEAVGFRCASCAAAFLRGVFLSCGTVSDPHKGYHLELLLPTRGRAEFIKRFLSAQLAEPRGVVRGGRWGLYYKSNTAISDLLYYIGCQATGFDVANISIERDIRNQENRATNCVTRNISQSVAASLRHREAIERLIATRRIDVLPDELRQTAALRMEYPSASLQELALLHEPPISKSGLNRRLSKLMEAAEEESDHKD